MFHDEPLTVRASLSVPDILNDLKKLQPVELTDGIKKNLDKIIKICNESYGDRSRFGHAAVNRSILLDSKIASLLTPAVIQYICTSPEKICVTSNLLGYERDVSLFDIIYYGLEDLLALKYMLNVKIEYSETDYINQKNQFDEITVKIVENIYVAAGREFIRNVFNQYTTIYSVSPQEIITELEILLQDCIDRVKILKDGDQSDKLLEFKTYSHDGRERVRKDVQLGFIKACNNLGIEIQFFHQNLSITLESFCHQFLRDEKNIILNGDISSLFYDRLHILGALELDAQVQFQDGSYTLGQVFDKLVKLIAAFPTNYPSSTIEQFYIRLKIVKNDLIQRFGSNPKEYVEKMNNEKKEAAEILSFSTRESQSILPFSQMTSSQAPEVYPFAKNRHTTFKHNENKTNQDEDLILKELNRGKQHLLLKIGKDIASLYNASCSEGIIHQTTSCSIRVMNYEEGNKAHNDVQPPKNVQFKFRSKESAVKFINYLKKNCTSSGLKEQLTKGIKHGNAYFSPELNLREYFVWVRPNVIEKLAAQLPLENLQNPTPVTNTVRKM